MMIVSNVLFFTDEILQMAMKYFENSDCEMQEFNSLQIILREKFVPSMRFTNRLNDGVHHQVCI